MSKREMKKYIIEETKIEFTKGNETNEIIFFILYSQLKVMIEQKKLKKQIE